eukprot:937890_1
MPVLVFPARRKKGAPQSSNISAPTRTQREMIRKERTTCSDAVRTPATKLNVRADSKIESVHTFGRGSRLKALPNQQVSSIKFRGQKLTEGNVHTGAIPPWELATSSHLRNETSTVVKYEPSHSYSQQ